MKMPWISHFLLVAACTLNAASLDVGGVGRSYVFQAPEGKGPFPLVIALHGGGGKASQMEKLTGLGALGKNEGFAVAYPEAVDRHWNDGRGDFKLESSADDVAFLLALRSRLVADRAA